MTFVIPLPLGSILGALIGFLLVHKYYLSILRWKRGPLVVGGLYRLDQDPYQERKMYARVTDLVDVGGSRGLLVKYSTVFSDSIEGVGSGSTSSCDEQTFRFLYPYQVEGSR